MLFVTALVLGILFLIGLIGLVESLIKKDLLSFFVSIMILTVFVVSINALKKEYTERKKQQ